MEIPMNVDVICDSEICGSSTYLVINPVNDQVTHLVVAEKVFPNVERLVSIKYITETTHTSIQLSCSPSEFAGMELFWDTDFIDSGKVEMIMPYYGNPFMLWPYSMYEAMPMPPEHERIPVGEVTIHRGTPVIATDGWIGKVDEFLVYSVNDCISHLILREGHFWEQKDVIIPVNNIDRIASDGVYLNMDKKSIEALPALPVQRKWK